MPDVKERLDVLLVKRGLAESRHRAQALILGGAVSVMGSPVMKAGLAVGVDADILVRAPGERYVSRGAHKLVAALDAFAMDVSGLTAVDVGASTGGFTDVLLRRGAAHVYAIDVGYGQLDWGLREDERVTVMERTNFRLMESLPEAPGLAVVDVSFISLALVFPVLARLLAPDATAVTLIKPQFEAGKGRVGKGGVVRDPAIHRQVLMSVLESARESGFSPAGLIESPLFGPAGNREFLAHLVREPVGTFHIEETVDALV